ncbi:MAG: sensor histidine kinase [Stellaceae bacterium]
MPHLSIRARLIFLAIVLLAMLGVLAALLSEELSYEAEDLATEVQLVSSVRNANIASKHFGDLKYWITDFAVTQLVRSQENADAAKALLAADLKTIAPFDPNGVAAIASEVGILSSVTHKAADAYSSDDSAEGSALMAQAQGHILKIDREIDKIVDGLEQRALVQRDASMHRAKAAVEFSVVGGIIALAVAVSLTALIVRSINRPLRRLERSMAAITRGELDVSIPPATRDEIGDMAKTLEMLRNSLVERERLESERKQAEAEIRSARDAAETALSELKTMQASLIHAEKMASLGQLTAGIAHEIKNPLNFVNNFAGLSVELLDELKVQVATAIETIDKGDRVEIDETIDTLTGNLDKIVEHGGRADNIVKSMLAHSRGGIGERQGVDLNALVDEALNLAYHGARAQDQSFNITLEREFDRSLAPIELAPQEMTRVFLNLIGNGFYAAHKREMANSDPTYRPTLYVATREAEGAVEIAVRDNGTGIPADIRDKLFHPFFTTKPTGEGTGLGLSISYDIVTQQHGGTIVVASEEGAYTEFTVRLPRREQAAPWGRA